jgi:hypothetical protein
MEFTVLILAIRCLLKDRRTHTKSLGRLEERRLCLWKTLQCSSKLLPLLPPEGATSTATS